MSSERTFVDSCLAGHAFLTDIDDYVDAWHDGDDPRDLGEFLGMTSDEYRLWVERPETLRFILSAHKNCVNVTDVVLRKADLMAAARTTEHDEAVKVVGWLMKTGRLSARDAA